MGCLDLARQRCLQVANIPRPLPPNRRRYRPRRQSPRAWPPLLVVDDIGKPRPDTLSVSPAAGRAFARRTSSKRSYRAL